MSYFLYAEDDKDDADILTEILRTHHKTCELVCVPNGYELIRHLENVQRDATYPCLIILDMRLPRLNGMETLQLLKTDDLYRLIPVLVFSSRLSELEEINCKALGADILAKPDSFMSWNEVIDYLGDYLD
jgi:CheY-like chemotaxis protein